MKGKVEKKKEEGAEAEATEAHNYPEHGPQIGISEAERDVGDVKSLRHLFR